MEDAENGAKMRVAILSNGLETSVLTDIKEGQRLRPGEGAGSRERVPTDREATKMGPDARTRPPIGAPSRCVGIS